MNRSIYTYRFIGRGATWGIYLEIEGEAYPLAIYQGTPFPVTEMLHFDREIYVPDDEFTQKVNYSYMQGLLLIADAFGQKVGTPTVIKILNTEWNPTDFQLEGFGYGIASWAIREYTLDVELPPVIYDRDQKRYIFPYTVEW